MGRIHSIYVIVGIALLCTLAGAWLWHRAQPHTEHAVLTALLWRRTVRVQRYTWTSHEHETDCPGAARDCESHDETLNSYQQQMGQSCVNLGHGITNCIPTYITMWNHGIRYSYQIQEWHDSRQVIAAGDGGTPHWPAVTLAGGAQPERIAGRDETYVAVYRAHSGTYRRALPRASWSRLQRGARYLLTLTSDGNLTGMQLESGS